MAPAISTAAVALFKSRAANQFAGLNSSPLAMLGPNSYRITWWNATPDGRIA